MFIVLSLQRTLWNIRVLKLRVYGQVALQKGCTGFTVLSANSRVFMSLFFTYISEINEK